MTTRTTEFLKDKLKIYEALVRSGLEIGDPESLRESFEAVEHAKSRTLVDLLANNITAVHPNRDSDVSRPAGRSHAKSEATRHSGCAARHRRPATHHPLTRDP